MLAATQSRRRVRLLVNQAAKPTDGRTVRQQLQAVVDRYVNPTLDGPLRIDLLGAVPSDPSVREAVQKRQLLMVGAPGSPAALGIVEAATRLVSEERRTS